VHICVTVETKYALAQAIGAAMSDPLYNLHLWDNADATVLADRVALLAERLPSGWSFQELSTHALGGQSHTIAFFSWEGIPFALIPGSMTTLGYDRDQRLRPDQFILHEPAYPPDMPHYDIYLEHLREDEQFLSQFADLDSYLAAGNIGKPYSRHFLTSLRTVHIAPFLLEVRSQDSYCTAATPHQTIQANIAKAGFRLPTSNEWEYACAAGTRSLFRWGNTCPNDRYPEAKYAGDYDDLSPWNEHEQPNAFGLSFPANPYDWEVCAEYNILRGGDGGSSICGGEEWFAAWLGLASAYAVEWHHQLIFGGRVRRAYTIP
jgi:Sulfatase-modifying factor enzyme 1